MSFASSTRFTMSARVPATVFCLVVVPHRTRATGVSGDRPFSTSRSTIFGRFFTPMKNTRVPIPFAKALQSISEEPFVGSSWPVMKATVEVNLRWVSGIPAYAGAAMADVTPGTISNGIPASISTSASSPPRPKTKGSPPLSRATVAPVLAFSTISALMPSWDKVWSPPFLPT